MCSTCKVEADESEQKERLMKHCHFQAAGEAEDRLKPHLPTNTHTDKKKKKKKEE